MDTRITICLTDGVLRGASHTADNGLPTELDLSQLGKLVPKLNLAAIARVKEIESAVDHVAEIARLKERIADLTAPVIDQPAPTIAAAVAAPSLMDKIRKIWTKP